MNLFKFFKFKINLLSPFGFGTKNTLEINSPAICLHLEMALIFNKFCIAISKSNDSCSDFG